MESGRFISCKWVDSCVGALLGSCSQPSGSFGARADGACKSYSS
jgi:hypothetical protein